MPFFSLRETGPFSYLFTYLSFFKILIIIGPTIKLINKAKIAASALLNVKAEKYLEVPVSMNIITVKHQIPIDFQRCFPFSFP